MTNPNAITAQSSSNGIERELLEILHDEMNVEVSSGDTDLLETGLLDSLKFVDLLVRIEERFGTKIELEELELDDFRSVRKVAAFLRNQRRKRQAGVSAADPQRGVQA